ncbi:hypothetical protein GCM10010247_11900 [Streptomyces calvus]|nr:hypothetical protein GCM10010247_11900 [Streptomyces calvus]
MPRVSPRLAGIPPLTSACGQSAVGPKAVGPKAARPEVRGLRGQVRAGGSDKQRLTEDAVLCVRTSAGDIARLALAAPGSDGIGGGDRTTFDVAIRRAGLSLLPRSRLRAVRGGGRGGE